MDVSTGIYFFRLTAGEFSRTIKMTMVPYAASAMLTRSLQT